MNAYINGEYRCYSTANGISRHYLGCRHMKPREAISHQPYLSHFRVSGEGSSRGPGFVPPSPVNADPSPEPRGSRSAVRHPGAVLPPPTT